MKLAELKLQTDWQRRGFCVALGVLASALSLALGFGFMVDDALITARVASQLWEHGAYRFNPRGPAVDCVTPLGFAWMVAPLAQGGVWPAFLRLREFGMLFHLLSGAVLGLALAPRLKASACQAAERSWLLPLLGCFTCLALCLPFGAWGSSGMETPFVTFLCTLALLPFSRFQGRLWIFTQLGPWALSVAGALRPELVPFCLARALLLPLTGVAAQATPETDEGEVGTSRSRGTATRRNAFKQRAARVGLVAAGPLLVVLVRVLVFHHPAPLAIFAKPAGASDGLSYLLSALRLLGLPCLLLGWGAWKHVGREARGCALACLVHAVAVFSAGGDWMPYFRLFVPLLPTLVWLGFCVAQRGVWWSNSLRFALASGFCLLLAWHSAAARGVLEARRAVSQQAAAYLQDAKVIGALDVGWVGASAEHAEIVDFAGITDERIARLPGGHTSKRLPPNLLDARHVDALILLMSPGITAADVAKTPWQRLPFARTVEQRVRTLSGAEEFEPAVVLPLNGTTQSYLLLRRNTSRFAVY